MTVKFETRRIFDFLESGEGLVGKEALKKCHLSEYASILEGGKYKGVEIDILDMSSGSRTGTFKDWVACATIAYCKENSIGRFVTQSSGNTANSIAHYCLKNEQHATIFYLKSNQDKLKPQFFRQNKYIELIEVDAKETRMKKVTKEYAEQNGIPWLPNLALQIFANSVRANFIVHAINHTERVYDWHSQSLSSGYGVFGLYEGLRRLDSTPTIKFLGVQQSAVCPFVERFAPNLLVDLDVGHEPILEPTLFRSKPTNNLYDSMSSILEEFGGAFSLVSNTIYKKYVESAVSFFNTAGIHIVTNDSDIIVEKSGVIDLVGCFWAIDNKLVPEGSRILMSLTGGCGQAPIGKVSPVRSVK